MTTRDSYSGSYGNQTIPGLPSPAGGYGQYIPLAVTTAANIYGQRDTNNANAQQARDQMDFQERMRSTQYQTAVQDMKLAGLNPALAYQQGGAGTPAGAQGAPKQNPIAAGVNAAMQQAQISNTQAQTKKTLAESNQINIESAERVRNLTADTEGKLMDPQTRSNIGWQQILNMRQQAEYSRQNQPLNLRQLAADAEASELGLPGARAQAEHDRTPWGRVMPYVNDAQSLTGTLNDMLGNFTPGGIFRNPRPQIETTTDAQTTRHSKGGSSSNRTTTRRKQ